MFYSPTNISSKNASLSRNYIFYHQKTNNPNKILSSQQFFCDIQYVKTNPNIKIVSMPPFFWLTNEKTSTNQPTLGSSYSRQPPSKTNTCRGDSFRSVASQVDSPMSSWCDVMVKVTEVGCGLLVVVCWFVVRFGCGRYSCILWFCW